jgi:hypothetical protein
MSIKAVLSSIRRRVAPMLPAGPSDRTPVILWSLLLAGIAIVAWAILAAL